MMHAAQAARRLLIPFHNRRWDSDFLTVQRLIAAGPLGAVHTFEACWDRYRPEVPDRWREREAQGGGLLFDLGTHLIDQALQLFGNPEWLQADVYCQRDGAKVDDAFELRMGRGRLRIVLGASALAAQARPRFRISGDLGCFIKDGIDPQEDQLRAGMSATAVGFGVEAPDTHGRIIAGAAQPSAAAAVVAAERGSWHVFYDSVRDSIENGTAPPVSAQQALQVLQVIEAARESSASGRRVALDAAAR